MEIGTILKNIKTGEQVEIIKIDDRAKTVIVKKSTGETRPYSMATLKDKRNYITLDSEPIPEPEPEITEEDSNLVPMPGIEKLVELKEEYSKEPGKKPRITITYNGESKTPNEWAAQFNMDPKKIRLALRKGKTPEEIFNGKNN